MEIWYFLCQQDVQTSEGSFCSTSLVQRPMESSQQNKAQNFSFGCYFMTKLAPEACLKGKTCCLRAMNVHSDKNKLRKHLYISSGTVNLLFLAGILLLQTDTQVSLLLTISSSSNNVSHPRLPWTLLLWDARTYGCKEMGKSSTISPKPRCLEAGSIPRSLSSQAHN